MPRHTVLCVCIAMLDTPLDKTWSVCPLLREGGHSAAVLVPTDSLKGVVATMTRHKF